MAPSLRKQPTFGDATTGFPAKWRLRNERRNSILMTHHYPDLGSASDWLNQISYPARPIRSTTQIWVVTRYQYGISAFGSQTSFDRETSGSVAKCWLFSQAIWSLSVPIKRLEFRENVRCFFPQGKKQTVCYIEVSVKLGLTVSYKLVIEILYLLKVF